MADEVRAYIDLLSSDEAGARTVTLVVEYGAKTARLDLGLGPLTGSEESMAAAVRREVHLLIDALETVDASVEGILASRPHGPADVSVETSGRPRSEPQHRSLSAAGRAAPRRRPLLAAAAGSLEPVRRATQRRRFPCNQPTASTRSAASARTTTT